MSRVYPARSTCVKSSEIAGNTQRWDEYESELDRLRDELDAVQTENERLRREKRQVLDVREENDELVRFAEAERDQRNRERDRRSAPVWRRAKYWIFGDPNARIDDA